MRKKLLGLLVAAVFVASAATTAFAAVSSTTFKAEISFASTNTAFGFALYEMSGNKPASGDGTATMIHWNTAFKPLAPGNGDGITYVGNNLPQTYFSNSRVYAKIECTSLAPNTFVRFYTDNTLGGANYKYHTSLSTPTKNPLAPMKSTSPVDAVGLPLTYKIVDSSATVFSKVAGTTIPYTDFTSMEELEISENGDKYGVFFTMDKSDPKFLEAKFGVTAEYSTIATDQGIKRGYDENPANPPHYTFAPGADAVYMFFATSAFFAKPAHRYGTDRLTVEVITE